MRLADEAERFAAALTDTIAAVLPGSNTIRAIEAPGQTKYVLQPVNEAGNLAQIPLLVGGVNLADMNIQIYLQLDTAGRYLKTVKSALSVKSILDKREPMVRLEYEAVLTQVPVAHWHFHAERGSLSHLLTLAQQNKPKMIDYPHTLSSLHFPVGGERFRPCTEDFLEFVVRELGVDRVTGWESALRAGRETWRRLQLRTVVRDMQSEAAEVLRNHGWSVTPPEGELTEGTTTLHKW